MITENKPLLSYLLLTYNQEKYIREAVESAFAQTYSPLEIIISDDHSTDNTWEIIKELFNKYNGPHKVIINRNKQNLGITNHVNKVMSMAKGELFIMAAGDDISFPNRTQKIYENWSVNRNKVFAMTSSMIGIDCDGKKCKATDINFKKEIYRLEVEDFHTKYKWCGAGAAYHRKLYDFFGPIKYDLNEDRVYINRCWLLGHIMLLDDNLLNYRFGGISTNRNNILKFKAQDAYWYKNSNLQLLFDLQKINTINKSKLQSSIQADIKYWILRYNLITEKSFYKKCHILLTIFKCFKLKRTKYLPFYLLPANTINKLYKWKTLFRFF